MNARWSTNFHYGRSGVFFPPLAGESGQPARTSKFAVINNQACFTGAVQSHWEYNNLTDDWYTTYWCGNAIKLTNASGSQTFTASGTDPFGFEVIRTWARLDPCNEDYSTSPMYDDNQSGAVEGNIWLAVDNGISGTVEYQNFDDSVCMYEMYRYGVNTNNFLGGFRSQWGYYIFAQNRFDLQNVPYSKGTLDLVNNVTYGLEKNYENEWAGNINTDCSNANPVGLKITHDGSKLRFYINPNPYHDVSNPYPNEYCLVGQVAVGWNSGMRIMLGHGSHYHATDLEDVRYDNLLIRTVADTVTSEIYPAKVTTNKKIDFTYIIKPSFRMTDSGIAELKIVKPSSYAGSWSNVQVFSEWGDSVNDNNISRMSNIFSGSPALQNEVLVVTNHSELQLRFCQVSDSVHSVIRSNTLNKQIEVRFTLKTPTTSSPVGESFTAYANCIKYSNTGYTTNSTTADKQFISGDASYTCYSAPAIRPDFNSSTVKVYTEPAAWSGITPSQVYVGSSDFDFLYNIVTSTTNTGPEISRAFITIPPGFSISNISSLRISSPSYIKVTNIDSTNRIYLNYKGAGVEIPAKGGIDNIGIKIKSTPVIGIYKWKSVVECDVQGTSGQLTRTNGIYKDQSVSVIPPSPNVTAYESMIDDKVYSTVTANIYNYYLLNNGAPENKVKLVRIELPSLFSRVTNMSSMIVPSSRIKFSNSSLWVDYNGAGTNITGGEYDCITFTAVDKVSPITVTNASLLSYADNFNGEGYKACKEGAQTWDISFVLPPAQAQASIKTNVIDAVYTTNQFIFKLYNNGSMSNEVYQARILVPGIFTNINSINSLKTPLISFTNRVIYLNYQPAKLKPGELDIITFKMKTRILYQTNVEVWSLVCNSPSTNYYQYTGIFGTESRVISTVYPSAKGEAYVELEGESTPPIIIDASTETNSLVYYIKNSGESGNDISLARIYFPQTVISNVFNFQSTNILQDTLNINWLNDGPGYRYLVLDYGLDGHPLQAGDTDIISFRMRDKITGFASFVMFSTISNIKEIRTNSNTTGKTQQVHIRIPPALAAGNILPNILYTSGQTVTNVFVYTVSNKGRGSNKIQRIFITNQSALALPMLKVSNTYFSGSTGVTNRGNSVLISYAAAGWPLQANSVDRIYLTVRSSITSITNARIELKADNYDGNQFVDTSTVSNNSKYIYLTDQPRTILEPSQIYTTSTQNSFVYTLINGGTMGRVLKKARIILPTPVFITNGISFDSFKWGGAVESRSNNFLVITYPVPLDAGQSDKISINARDVLTEGQTNVIWDAEVDYGDGFGWRKTRPLVDGTNAVQIVLPPAQA
ncbi:MAG: hypothetical protein PHF84_00230, partial [bacterium]|nr:hypothetical protein [bacterium]